jgi:Tol biopolymer transport system component
MPTTRVTTSVDTILGTVGYMSPEQVRRSPADHRSDIFSLGSIVYEMLAGRCAFAGDTEAEVMTGILNAEPPALTEANGKVPPALERIVRHCLEKRPEDRFQSARDLAFGLESLAAARDGFAFEGARTLRRPVVAIIAAATLGGVLALGGAFLKPPQARPVFKQVTFRRGSIAEARFAPDGQTIVYGAVIEGQHNRLFSARLGSPEVRALELPEGDIAAITTSGEMAIVLGRSYWGRADGTLARVSLAGGAPRELLEHVSMADWGPDGTSLAVIRGDGPEPRLEFPIGKVLYTGLAWNPRVSPKGNLVAFRANDGTCKVKVVDLSGKATTLATAECGLGLAWSPSGDEVWYTEWEVIRAVTLGGRQRVLTGFPGPAALNDVSADGRVLVTTAQWYNGLVFSGPREPKERDLAWFEWAVLGALSPDGASLLFSDRGSGTGPPFPRQTYFRRTDGSPAVRLGEGSALSLSPDGKWATAVPLPDTTGTRPVSRARQCLLLPTGPGEPRPLPVGDLECEYASFFPDGKRILVSGSEPGGPRRLFVQDMSGGSRRPLTTGELALGAFNAVDYGNFIAEVSPDGMLVVVTDESARLVLVPVEGGPPRPIPGIRPHEASAGWGADSQSLYVYATEADFPVRVDRIHLPSGRREIFKQITPPELAATGGVNKVRVTPDGKAYAYGYGHYPCILYVIEGLR